MSFENAVKVVVSAQGWEEWEAEQWLIETFGDTFVTVEEAKFAMRWLGLTVVEPKVSWIKRLIHKLIFW